MNNLKHFSLTMLVALVSGISAYAYDVEIEGIYYNFSTSYYDYELDKWIYGNFALVTHDNNYVDVDPDPTKTNLQLVGGHYCGNVIIPETFIFDDNEYKVIDVGQHAFSNCENLISIQLPSTIRSIGYGAFYNSNSLQTVNIPSSVTSIGSWAFYKTAITEIDIPEGVTVLGNCMCYGCSILQRVSLPNTLTKIEQNAFYECSQLHDINIPSSVQEIQDYVFEDCSSLEEIVLPEGIQYIGRYLFLGCSSLKSVNIPQSVKSIRNSAFRGCSSLHSITIPENSSLVFENGAMDLYPGIVYNLSNMDFDGFEHIFSNKVIVGDYVFGKKENQWYFTEYIGKETELVLPNDIEGNEYELYSINLLPKDITAISFGTSITNVPEYYFREYTNIYALNLDNINSIGTGAFYGCSGLNTVTLGKDINSVGESAFANCNNIKTLNYNIVDFDNEGVNPWYSNTPLYFPYVEFLNIGEDVEVIPKGLCYNNKKITKVEIADSLKVRTIGEKAFENCSALEELTLGKNISSIGAKVFAGCNSLKTLNYNIVSFENQCENAFGNSDIEAFNKNKIPLHFPTVETLNIGEDVELIPRFLFYKNTHLTKVNIADTTKVTSIGNLAFAGCSALEELTLGQHLISIGAGAFYDCAKLKTLNYNISCFENNPTIEVHYDIDDYHGVGGTLLPLNFTNVDSLNIGENVELIPRSLFANNKFLTTVQIADTAKVRAVGEYAFSDCTNLKSLDMRSVETIGNSAFKSCSSLSSIDVRSANAIDNYAFYCCSNLRNINLKGVRTIGMYAFSKCDSISSLSIGNSLNNIGEYAFSFNAPLEKLTVSNDYGLNYMLGKEYYDDTDYCYKSVVKKLVIAEDFADEQITGDFTNQNNLETIESNTVEPLAFALANPFTESQYSSIAVKVPEESAEKYKAAPVWKLFYVTSADCLLKLYNGSSEMQLIPQDGTERPEEATAVNAVMLIDEQLEAGNGLLTMGNVVYRNKQNNWVAGKINLSDAKPFYNPVDAVAQTINYVRNFTSTNLQALYLPYAMSYDDWKDKAKVSYINDVHQFDDDDDGEIDRTVLEFISVKSGELAPNIPYLIKPLEKGETTFTSSNKTLKATLSDGYIDCSSTRMLYTLKGTYQTRDDIYANGYYAMSGGTFKVADNAGVTLSPFRVFLSITNRYGNGAVPRAKKITIMVDGVEEETTDIDEIMMSDAKPTEIYNLQGVHVNEGYKGIVIRNGRKVLVK